VLHTNDLLLHQQTRLDTRPIFQISGDPPWALRLSIANIGHVVCRVPKFHFKHLIGKTGGSDDSSLKRLVEMRSTGKTLIITSILLLLARFRRICAPRRTKKRRRRPGRFGDGRPTACSRAAAPTGLPYSICEHLIANPVPVYLCSFVDTLCFGGDLPSHMRL